MKRYKRRMDYGTAGNEILSIGPMPEFCESQNGWIDIPLNGIEIPQNVLNVVEKEGFVILTRLSA